MELCIPTVLEDDLVVRLLSKIKYKEKPYAYIISRKPIEILFNYINTLTTEYLQCRQTSQQAAFSKQAVTT